LIASAAVTGSSMSLPSFIHGTSRDEKVVLGSVAVVTKITPSDHSFLI
jgi:hypothetical protein